MMKGGAKQATYSYFVRLSSASRYSPLAPVPTAHHVLAEGSREKSGCLEMRHTTSEESANMLRQPKLLRVFLLHRLDQLLEDHGYWLGLFVCGRRGRALGRFLAGTLWSAKNSIDRHHSPCDNETTRLTRSDLHLRQYQLSSSGSSSMRNGGSRHMKWNDRGQPSQQRNLPIPRHAEQKSWFGCWKKKSVQAVMHHVSPRRRGVRKMQDLQVRKA